MTDRSCEEILEMIALGADGDARDLRAVADHLRDCAACREESGRIRSILRELEASKEAAPPADLDARIRELLLGESPARATWLRPGWAMLLSLVSGSGLSTAFVLAVTHAGAGESAAILGTLLPVGYLVFSCVAVLPILLYRCRPAAPVEVK